MSRRKKHRVTITVYFETPISRNVATKYVTGAVIDMCGCHQPRKDEADYEDRVACGDVVVVELAP